MLTTYIQDTSKHLFKLSPWVGVGPKLVSACPPHTQFWVSSPAWQQMNNPISTLPRSWWPLPLHPRRNQDRVLSTFPKVTQLINYDLREKVPESILWVMGLSTTCLDEGNFYSRTFFLNLYIVPLIMVRTRAVITERSGSRRKHLEGEGETDQAPCRAGWLNMQLRTV